MIQCLRIVEEAGLENVHMKRIQLVWSINPLALTHVACAF